MDAYDGTKGEPTMSQFLYVYRGGNTPTAPEEMQKVMQKWVAWMKDLGANLKDAGNPLERTGKVVHGSKGITDGPFAEAKDLIGGYTLVEARDLAHASELAKGCPILERGGVVEVRPIMKMNM
jgi:hypothetical protein